MAAQLADDVKTPAVQNVRRSEMSRFLRACQEAKAPSEALRKAMADTNRKK